MSNLGKFCVTVATYTFMFGLVGGTVTRALFPSVNPVLVPLIMLSGLVFSMIAEFVKNLLIRSKHL